jgi:hypothetical protein
MRVDVLMLGCCYWSCLWVIEGTVVDLDGVVWQVVGRGVIRITLLGGSW